jgi:hypothetical protein
VDRLVLKTIRQQQAVFSAWRDNAWRTEKPVNVAEPLRFRRLAGTKSKKNKRNVDGFPAFSLEGAFTLQLHLITAYEKEI